MTAFAKLRRLFRLGRPPRLVIAAAILVSLIEVGTSLLFPILTRGIIDALPAADTSPLAMLAEPRILLLLAVVLVGAGASGLSGYLLARSAERIARALKRCLFVALLGKPVAFFDANESGDLVSRITSDTQVISLIGTKYLAGLVNGLLLLSGSAVILYLLDPALTLAILVIIGLSFVVMAPSLFKIMAITKEMNERRARISADVSRVFGEVRLVKAMSAEQVESGRIGQRLDDAYAANLRFARIEALLAPVNGFALTGAMIAIFTYGASRVAGGAMTIGTLTVFILYIFNVVGPLIQISAFLTQFQTALGSSSHLHDFLEGEPALQAPAHGAPAGAPSGNGATIRLEQVEFAYPGRPGIGLSIEALEFPAGSKTAIIGPSGAGKTTLFSLLERFYPLDGGRILYGGKDIAALDVGLWRRKLGYVSQAAPLMNGTIAENILYGAAGPHDELRLRASAEAGHCMDFVSGLERGFETLVGEAGVLLSGGQKQRIALARMFYRNPEIVLLDEATANLDEANEAAVLASVATLIEGRTAIIITHRMSTLSAVDRVVVLERGTVADVLPPEEVLRQRERYRRALAPSSDEV